MFVMEFEDIETDLADLVQEKIEFGKKLFERTHKYKELEGMPKLQRNLKQEIKFLEKILRNKSYKSEHLQCSNLTHFTAVLNVLEHTKDNVSVMKVFKSNNSPNVTVDIVCENGLKWVKVVARNPKSLGQISMGDTSYGSKSIIDKAKNFIAVSKQYPKLFQTPLIVFSFAHGVGTNLSSAIESYGIIVEGERIDDDYFFLEEQEEDDSLENENFHHPALFAENSDGINKINLDVSAMLAYCSSITNGSAGLFKFDVPILTQVAKCELERPQKPILDNFFEGKKLYCCQTAYESFIEIVNIIGGCNEKIRAKELLKRVEVLPDDASEEDIYCQINKQLNTQYSPDKEIEIGGQITERSLKVFRFGDHIRAVTVSANAGFVRSAMQQGVNFVVFLHESRALTEQKELVKGSPL